jgi:cell division septation protein DedD
MTEEDKALIMGVTGELKGSQVSIQQPANIQPKPVITQESEDDMLVRRILKRASKPAVTCGVKWSNFPEKQFEMLDMMSVDTEKIIDYFLQSIDLEALREEVKFGIEKYIYDYFGNEKEIAEFNESFEPEVVEKEPVEKPKTTKKPTTKKTTKKK